MILKWTSFQLTNVKIFPTIVDRYVLILLLLGVLVKSANVTLRVKRGT